MNQFAKIFTELEFNPLQLNDNASESDIQNLEKRLACKLPSEILALLRNHNGMKFSGVFPFRLMSITEILDLCDFFEWQENLKRNLEDAERICLFWTDDNGNYAGLYISGLLKGKICFIDHEELDLAPRYNSIYSFYKILLGIAKKNVVKNISDEYLINWSEMKTDFPILEYSANNNENSELARRFTEKYKNEYDEEKKQYFAFCAMNLLPMSETENLLEFTKSEDMWVQEKACELIGKKKYEPGISILVDVVKHGMHNGKMASMIALRNFKTKESEKEVKNLYQEVEEGYKIYLGPIR